MGAASASEFRDDLDEAHDVPIELLELRCGHPQLGALAVSHRLNGISREIFRSDGEASDEARPALAHVPVARDARRLRLVREGVEDRLFGQTRWKRAPVRRRDEIELRGTHGS